MKRLTERSSDTKCCASPISGLSLEVPTGRSECRRCLCCEQFFEQGPVLRPVTLAGAWVDMPRFADLDESAAPGSRAPMRVADVSVRIIRTGDYDGRERKALQRNGGESRSLNGDRGHRDHAHDSLVPVVRNRRPSHVRSRAVLQPGPLNFPVPPDLRPSVLCCCDRVCDASDGNVTRPARPPLPKTCSQRSLWSTSMAPSVAWTGSLASSPVAYAMSSAARTPAIAKAGQLHPCDDRTFCTTAHRQHVFTTLLWTRGHPCCSDICNFLNWEQLLQTISVTDLVHAFAADLASADTAENTGSSRVLPPIRHKHAQASTCMRVI